MKSPLRMICLLVLAGSLAPCAFAQSIGEREFVDDFLTIPGDVMDFIGGLLPESSNAGAAFVSDIYSPNLNLVEDATIQVTFLWEGAGYENAFGYFTYLENPDSTITIVDKQLILPNASFPGGGELATGDTVTLRGVDKSTRVFPAGTQIGFFVVSDGWARDDLIEDWDPETSPVPSADPHVNKTQANRACYTTLDRLNPENDDNSPELARHFVMLRVDGREGFLNGEDFLVTGLEDLDRSSNSDDDFNDIVFLVRADPPSAISDEDQFHFADGDPDGDGVESPDDEYPHDEDRAFVTRYPTHGDFTLAAEENYPDVGDHDFNDVVLAYNYVTVADANNEIKDVMGTFHLVARGADLDHRFGVHVPGLPLAADGTVAVERFVDTGERTVEPSVTVQDIITLHDRRIDYLFPSTITALRPAHHSYTNTSSDEGPDCGAASVRFVMTFDAAIDPAVLGSVPYDPYIAIHHYPDEYDVHISGKPGFASRAAGLPAESGGSTFLDEDGYAYILNLPGRWRFPLEGINLASAYPDFLTWFLTAGLVGNSWYENPSHASDRVSADLSLYIPPRAWVVRLPDQ
ncbi:MAG: LruC domain-containing protein [Planctomycetota bacterium]